MTREEEAVLKRFESLTRQLIFLYKNQKKENERLKEDNKSLKEQLEAMQQDYADLKTARIIEISDGDMKNAKGKLARLIRDIDKCIALLKA